MRQHALDIFNTAVAAVQPNNLLNKFIEVNNNSLRLGDQYYNWEEKKNIFVIGAGKASAAMAVEVEKILGNRIKEGIIITKYGHALPLNIIRCIEASHPVPDENGLKATSSIIQLLQQVGENDLVISLISGGASALLADVPPNISLRNLQHLFKQLLDSGATISEMNAVRKHLSQIKGGQLSRLALPATLTSFILSDVIGNDLSVIASGPTVGDPSTFNDAIAVLKKYNLNQKVASSIFTYLQNGTKGKILETPKPGDIAFSKTHNYLIGSNGIALKAAAEKATSLGYKTIILTDALSGEAKEKAAELVTFLFSQKREDNNRTCYLMGGETTVTIKGAGKGGRNQEYALAALQALMQKEQHANDKDWIILSAGTDGTDGPTDAAGAFIDHDVLGNTLLHHLNPTHFLENNDAYHFFKKAGGLVFTGATQTNVMDIIIAIR